MRQTSVRRLPLLLIRDITSDLFDLLQMSPTTHQDSHRVDRVNKSSVSAYSNPSKVSKARPSKKRSSSFTAVSFFSGCGGMDLGFKGGFSFKGRAFSHLPFDILAAYDHDAKCVATYNLHFKKPASQADLAKLPVPNTPKASILLGGFPCQDFSSCGPKRGLSSERGNLYKVMVEYMRIHRPMIVVGENVPHLEKMHGGEALGTIISDMEEAGYNARVWKLKAVDYGIPQDRVRLFIIGVRDNLPGFPKEPTKPLLKHLPTISWALDDLLKVRDDSVPNQSQFFLASKAKRGNGQGDETNAPDRPAYTIRANAKSRVQFHYKLPRRLTIRECARLQTFPDEFLFPHSATTNLMQIGNAVPPVLAHYVAMSVKNYLSNILDPL